MPDWTQRDTRQATYGDELPRVDFSQYNEYDPELYDTEIDTTPDTPGVFKGGTLAGAGLLAGAGGLVYALSKLKNAPGLGGAVGKVANFLNAARMQSMLSGLAVPKSLLGNLGAGVIESIERGSMRPLRELLSTETLKDVGRAYKEAAQVGPALQGSAVHGPGRVMGAFDTATRNALQRGGLTAQEAERAVLQAPLPSGLAESLDSAPMRYLIPFRRTPFNQFIEGGKTMQNLSKYPGTNALVYGAGAAHGALTADDPYPMSIGLGAAAAARYGLPYTIGAMIGRQYLGGNDNLASVASSALPLSEYGFASGISDPTRPFTSPAILSLLGGR